MTEIQPPLFDGPPHVADDVIVSEQPPGLTFQPCRVCGAPLVAKPTGAGGLVPDSLYATGALVGFGCPGKKQRRKRDDDDV